MGNYSYLTLESETSVEALQEILEKINRAWFMCSLDIEVNLEGDDKDYIFWLHSDGFRWDFQIWLNKADGTKITYHPNVQPIDVTIIEEFIAIKLSQKLGGKITYEC